MVIQLHILQHLEYVFLILLVERIQVLQYRSLEQKWLLRDVGDVLSQQVQADELYVDSVDMDGPLANV